jgi:hypothetical protein
MAYDPSAPPTAEYAGPYTTNAFGEKIPSNSTQQPTNQAGVNMDTSNPYMQAAQATAAGNLANARAATAANRVNQVTPYGSLTYSQSGTDAYGNPMWTANQQLSQPLQQLTDTSLAGLQASQANPMYGINPGQTYSDAIMQRLQPQIAQNAESQKAALANQGIVPGTQAYDNAMRTFNQGQNDLLTSAQINGMQTGLQAQSLQNATAANIKNLSTPGYVNPYSQAAVSGPDYLQAYNASQAANIAQQNANIAKTTNMQSGLYGLGGALIQGSGGLGGLGNTVGSGLSGLANLGTGISNWWNGLNNGGSSGVIGGYQQLTSGNATDLGQTDLSGDNTYFYQ